MSLVIAGCATTATTLLGDPATYPAGMTQVIASYHQDLCCGIHRVGTMTWIRAEKVLPCNEIQPLDEMTRGKWDLRFSAPACSVGEVKTWLNDHRNALAGGFERMLDYVNSAFPQNGGRRLRVLVIPGGYGLDRAWEYLATNDNQLELTYALPLPNSQSPNGKSVEDVFPVIAHEFGHSYFWFHPGQFRNNFSDEVVGYTLELCMQYHLSGKIPDAMHGPQELEQDAGTLSSSQVFARFHTKYPDTVTAPFAALNELRRHVESPRNAMDYCRLAPLSGRDFTKAE